MNARLFQSKRINRKSELRYPPTLVIVDIHLNTYLNQSIDQFLHSIADMID